MTVHESESCLANELPIGRPQSVYRLAPIFLCAILLFVPQVALAAVYKCAQSDGRIAYQASPCPDERGSSRLELREAPAKSSPSGAVRGKGMGDQKPINIDFSDMPLYTVLHMLADVSGNKLSYSPGFNISGKFVYNHQTWDVILEDIAKRYHLIVKVEDGTIHVRHK